jgi:hypothetical protein
MVRTADGMREDWQGKDVAIPIHVSTQYSRVRDTCREIQLVQLADIACHLSPTDRLCFSDKKTMPGQSPVKRPGTSRWRNRCHSDVSPNEMTEATVVIIGKPLQQDCLDGRRRTFTGWMTWSVRGQE